MSDDIGISVLQSYDLETGTSTADVFRESSGDTEPPRVRALALQSSVEDDFPNRLWSIADNRRSRWLSYAHRMVAWGLKDSITPYEDYQQTAQEHSLIEQRCTCGWSPRLGESVRRAFDKHLLDSKEDQWPSH